jgi:hypothetical protein
LAELLTPVARRLLASPTAEVLDWHRAADLRGAYPPVKPAGERV